MSKTLIHSDDSDVIAKRRGRPRISVEDRLLGAIERLLSKGQTFSTLTVEALAAEAHISRATFYIRYSEKNALVAALLERISDDIVVSSGSWFNGQDDADPVVLNAALKGIVYAFKRHQAVLAAVAETAPFDTTVANLHRDMLDRLRAQSRAAIAKVRQQGRAHPMATDVLADLLTDTIELYCSRNLRDLGQPALDELAAQLAHMASHAIFSRDVMKRFDAPAAGSRQVAKSKS